MASGWRPTHKTCLEMEAEFTSAQNVHLHVSKGIPILGSSPYCYNCNATINWSRQRSTSKTREIPLASPRSPRIFQKSVHCALFSLPLFCPWHFCFLSFLSLCGLGLASSHMPRSRLPGLAIYFKGETSHFMH